MYVQKAPAAGLQSIFSLNWECSGRKMSWSNPLVNMLMTDLLANVLNGIYLTSNVLQLQKSLIFVVLLADGHGLSRWLNANRPEHMDSWGLAPSKNITKLSMYQGIKQKHLTIKICFVQMMPFMLFRDLTSKIWARADSLGQEKRGVKAVSNFSVLHLCLTTTCILEIIPKLCIS